MSGPEFEQIPGMRVGVVRSIEERKVYIYGFGIYEGNFRPPVEIRYDDNDMQGAAQRNPRILLDNGKVVWDFECYWMSENDLRELLKEADTVVNVDIDEDRRNSAELNSN